MTGRNGALTAGRSEQLADRAGCPAPLTEASSNGFRDLMTEQELVKFLRIDVVSGAANLHHVIENLKRMRALPCIYIANKPLYPRAAILRWIEQQTEVKP